MGAEPTVSGAQEALSPTPAEPRAYGSPRISTQDCEDFLDFDVDFDFDFDLDSDLISRISQDCSIWI